MILEAANGDPLRAQEIDEKLGREWWEYYLVYSHEKTQAMNERMKENANGE